MFEEEKLVRGLRWVSLVLEDSRLSDWVALQVKFQCLPTATAGHGRILRDRANWYLETVRNHLGQSPKRSDSSRDRWAPGPARWPRRNSEQSTTSDSPSAGWLTAGWRFQSAR